MAGVKKLLTPLTMGPYTLRNRVVMAPLTRTRAGDRNVPREMNLLYYRQRATAGLVISEAASVSPRGYGYYGTPGTHTEEQRDARKRITDAVHEESGLMLPAVIDEYRRFRPLITGNTRLIVAGGYKTGDAESLVDRGIADAAASEDCSYRILIFRSALS